MSKRVLSVGQCGPDHSCLTRFLTSHFDVEVIPACIGCDAMQKLRNGKYDLVLINRKLDEDYSDGMEIVKAIKGDAELASVPVMLITNYCQHQEEAIAAGAIRGFGKMEYNKPETLERLKAVLA